ncbi:MAG: tRNA lysidine(34) synthetase TilS [Planctomycetes bacterium]|nr:tRNA lysidine(34) synthetase TilS [Planctomycetota bacterium]
MQSKEQKEFYKAIDDQIASCDLPPGCNRWLLGVSGGCDSMGLMHGLAGLRELYPDRFDYLHVAHLNHLLRGAESDADAAFVVEQADQLGLPVTVESIDVGAAAQQAGTSVETAARDERYKFYAKTARQFNCQVVATGHNADDNAETILHRIIRGTGIRGLRGIPMVRALTDGVGEDLWLIRPVLSLRRQEIEAFLKEVNHPWREDQSNQSLDFTRNRIRHELIPFLQKKFNPQVAESLLRLGRTAEMFCGITANKSGAALADYLLERGDDWLKLDAARLAAEPEDRQSDVIFELLVALEIPLQKIGGKHLNSIHKLIKNSSEGGQNYHYPSGLRLKSEKDGLVFRRQTGGDQVDKICVPDEQILPMSGAIDIPGDFFKMEPSSMMPLPVNKILIEQVSGGIEYLHEFCKKKYSFCEIFDLDRVQGQLRLRAWQEGGRFMPLGMTGEKTLGDFFTDMKVPAPWRQQVGLICDDLGILWVLGLRISDRIKVRKGTSRILRLTVSGGSADAV